MGFKQQKQLFSVIIRCALLKIIKTSNYMFVCYIVTLLLFLEAQHRPFTHLNMKQNGEHVKNSLSKACANIFYFSRCKITFYTSYNSNTEANW